MPQHVLVLEHADGALTAASHALVKTARQIAAPAGASLVGLLLGDDVAAAANDASRYLPSIVTLAHPVLEPRRSDLWAHAISTAAADIGADIVLFPSRKWSSAVAPRVAMRLDAPLIEDAIGIVARAPAGWTAKRATYLARATETIETDDARTVVTMKTEPGPSATPLEHAGSIAPFDWTEPPSLLEVDGQEQRGAQRVPLEEAAIIVSGGRGVGSPEAFSQLVEGLAEAVGAGVGATRAVVDAGWRPYDEQIGQTGRSVTPKVYLAVAMSGAIQHLSGMNRSRTVIAINTDPEAAIVKQSDLALIADVHEIVPAVLKHLAEEPWEG